MGAAIGIFGLGVMGRSLALQLAEKGVAVAAYDPWTEARAEAAAAGVPGIAATPEAFAASLEKPGTVLLMVKAGEPVDDAIARLSALLPAGALLADGGNSHFRDSERRAAALAARGIGFLGIGISGGETGARHGASIMTGGDAAGFERISPLLRQVAALAGGKPCLAHFGSAGAGHFAKMVHNAIEYAEMQLIAEAVFLLRTATGAAWPEIAASAAQWNRGLGACYLLEITAEILRARDRGTGLPIMEIVVGRAEQKGTGRWAAIEALELGVPVPTLIEAVEARSLSALREPSAPGALAAAPVAAAPPVPQELGEALLAARIAVYDQGFALLRAAAEPHGITGDLAELAEIWRAGCIIRGALLDPIAAALRAGPSRLLLAPGLREAVTPRLQAWRRTAASATSLGVPVPALASALAYYDGLRAEHSSASLLQLQRDTFGAHGFERVDRKGRFHIDRAE
ncbi:MAG TPA: NADP-dependent phosphogluconate dehydrogenase [Stellaceae bacterium]|nr:NADP-dependent phosphogluconate dehydrogenase [Stellaceae bacterium]